MHASESVHADVRWFEVDRSDVTQAKDRALAAVGAQTTESPATDSKAGVALTTDNTPSLSESSLESHSTK